MKRLHPVYTKDSSRAILLRLAQISVEASQGGYGRFKIAYFICTSQSSSRCSNPDCFSISFSHRGGWYDRETARHGNFLARVASMP